MPTVFLFLFISNAFMTYAWYGHLKDHANKSLFVVILLSWGVALFEYCFQVPANRMGFKFLTLPQLKIIQEVISLTVFAAFSLIYMKVPLTKNYLFACLCIMGAVYFIFKDKSAIQ
jgi:uncharacterized protein (DUF486 family)